jgi:NADH dehydrogenase [ubiquinone] 1 alpha subcomplex assembly factor 1
MPRTAAAPLQTLFDFADPSDVAAWEAVGDSVMGGVSTGRLVALARGAAAFTGSVSLDRGGGFASVRSAPGVFDLSPYDGIRVEAVGDGRAYKLSIRTDPFFDAVAYQARFATRPDVREAHELPFASFRPTWRGRPVPGAPPVEPSRVVSFGIVVGEGQAGPFRLEVATIRAYARR